MNLEDADVEVLKIGGQNLLTEVRIGIGMDLTGEGVEKLPNFVIMGVSSRDTDGNETELVYGMSIQQYVHVVTKMAEFLKDEDVWEYFQ